jgi:hypothetical protein
MPYTLEVPAYDEKHYQWVVRYACYAGRYKWAAYWSKSGMVPFGTFPLSFWVDVGKGNLKDINLTLISDEQAISWDEGQQLAYKKADEIIASVIKPEMTEFERALAIYDYIIDHTVYYSDQAAVERKLPVMEAVWSLYASLVCGVTVCGGYADAMNHLLHKARVESGRVGNNTHAWNKLKIGGRYFHADATISGGNYRHFLQSADQVWATGNLFNRGEKPVCKEVFQFKASYFPHKELFKSDKFFRIIGTVKLPDAEKAPKGGLWIGIRGLKYFIPEGENSTWYMMRVYYKDLKDKEEAIALDIKQESSLYLPLCYYAESGTTPKAELATRVPVRCGDLTGIDITLLKGSKTVAGTLFLPKGNTAPANGLKIWVDLFAGEKGDKKVSWTAFVIPEGQSSVVYSIPLGEMESYKYIISYGLISADYVSRGYFKDSQTTVSSKKLAQFVDLSEKDKAININLNIMAGNLLQGKVQLSEGVLAPAKGVEVKVTWYYKNEIDGGFWSGGSSKVTIPEGKQETLIAFRIPLDLQQKIRLGYEVKTDTLKLAGFYPPAPVVKEWASAGFFLMEKDTVDIVVVMDK